MHLDESAFRTSDLLVSTDLEARRRAPATINLRQAARRCSAVTCLKVMHVGSENLEAHGKCAMPGALLAW
jgi:hypothetical protein